MTRQQIEDNLVDFYNTHDVPIRRDDKEKIHNLINKFYHKNEYYMLTMCVTFLEMIKEERKHD